MNATCKFYKKYGNCRLGDNCRFKHDVTDKKPDKSDGNGSNGQRDGNKPKSEGQKENAGSNGNKPENKSTGSNVNHVRDTGASVFQ